MTKAGGVTLSRLSVLIRSASTDRNALAKDHRLWLFHSCAPRAYRGKP
ncbi:hypothetical protein QBD01_005099 [Ochrobactrum sp. 19YEA23]|nr:hypothetical protein [Ochrobactrum sp. 19YEA23]